MKAAQQIRQNCYLMRLLRLGRVATRIYAEELHASGLTPQQQQLLTAIVLMRNPSPSDLARVMNFEKSTVSRNLRFLVDAGLVDEEKTPGNRTRRVSMSADGLERLGDLLEGWQSAQARMEKTFGRSKIRGVRDAIETLLESEAESP